MKYNYEDQLDSIRVDIYKKTKDMTNNDAARITNVHAKLIAEQYGIKIVRATSSYIEK
jgi:hypothetical protein